eukprot:362927-Chlamydomonas_euryale.AAC.13
MPARRSGRRRGRAGESARPVSAAGPTIARSVVAARMPRRAASRMGGESSVKAWVPAVESGALDVRYQEGVAALHPTCLRKDLRLRGPPRFAWRAPDRRRRRRTRASRPARHGSSTQAMTRPRRARRRRAAEG